MTSVGGPAPFGVYVHVPFCRHRCGYCAFATYDDRDHLRARYVAACRTEVLSAIDEGQLPPATSVFVGGGTPSRLSADEVCSILDLVPRRAGAEVTVECNPEDIEPGRLERYREGGVTRISFGLQSAVPHVLEALDRRHRLEQAASAAEAVAAAGFSSWNVDLLFGVRPESDADWRATLRFVLDLPHPPPHVSAYALTVEPGTPLWRKEHLAPDEDALVRRYEEADKWLSAAGYEWEEISNWAKPGHHSAHHALYWAQGDYRGFGSAAHSHAAGRRWWNVRTPERYVSLVEAGRSPVGGGERLEPSQVAFERLVLSLRTPRGVPVSSLPGAEDDPELSSLVQRRGDRFVLTVRGRLLANEVAARLVA